MKILFLLNLFTLITICLGQDNPFSKIRHDSIVAYEFNGDKGVLIEDCLDGKKELIHKSLILSSIKKGELEGILTSDSAYGNTFMSCFDPHFAIVYYLNEKIVGTINICLDCNYLIATEKIPSTEFETIMVSDDYSYPAKGFNKNTRRELFKFIEELEFTKYLKPLTSSFDN